MKVHQHVGCGLVDPHRFVSVQQDFARLRGEAVVVALPLKFFLLPLFDGGGGVNGFGRGTLRMKQTPGALKSDVRRAKREVTVERDVKPQRPPGVRASGRCDVSGVRARAPDHGPAVARAGGVTTVTELGEEISVADTGWTGGGRGEGVPARCPVQHCGHDYYVAAGTQTQPRV